ncbi:MAG: glycosyltransferase family 4 protein [Nitrososphaeria archaeon]
MRVIEVSTNLIPSPPPKGGAIEKHVFNISSTLATLGLEVHLISVDEKYCISKVNGIIRHTYPRESVILDEIMNKVLCKLSSHAIKMNIISTTLKVYDILLFIKETYGLLDVIHNHSLTTALPPIIFKKVHSHRTSLIMHHHNVFPQRMVHIVALKQYDLHLAVSKYVKNEVIKRFRIPSDRIYVVYNAINVNEYKCLDSRQSRLREFFGIDKDEIVLMYAGRITPEKGLHHLIKAFKIVRQRLAHKRIKLLIVGPIGQFCSASLEDSTYFRYIQKLVNIYGLHSYVKYMGYLDRNMMIDVYSTADIIVVPSIFQDPFNFVVVEALASCKPVVAYPVGGIPEILGPLNYNFLARAVSPVELSEAIIKVISNYDNVDTRYLREYVEKRFSLESAAKRLKTIFEIHVKK